jgi:hypothetical protein
MEFFSVWGSALSEEDNWICHCDVTGTAASGVSWNEDYEQL